ncbi:MAG: hypothetical protein GXC73_12600 [Chitinophagaceae bacterium]|nr:hypothetical protein [Chitinophagaceae bacterium]
MSNTITVLMTDDDIDNFNSLKNKAAHQGILLKYAESLEEMLELIRKDLQTDAVILDGKGFRKAGQAKGTEKEDFVHEALTELKILEKEQNRIIPRCVYTAWYDQLKDGLESRVRVFDKKKLALDAKLMNEMFDYLKGEVSASSSKKIRTKYQQVLAGVGGKYIPQDKEPVVLRVFSLVEENGTVQQADFNSIREVFESILIRANTIDVAFIPNDLIKPDGRPNLEWCYRYISGLPTDVKDASNAVVNSYPAKPPIVPQHISRSIDYVKQVSSILSHNYPDAWTPFSFKSAALALAEIIIWFKQYIDSKYPTI